MHNIADNCWKVTINVKCYNNNNYTRRLLFHGEQKGKYYHSILLLSQAFNKKYMLKNHSYQLNWRKNNWFSKINSSEECLTCGVPQGSILGTLILILYVDDLHKALKDSYCIIS